MENTTTLATQAAALRAQARAEDHALSQGASREEALAAGESAYDAATAK